VLPGESDHGKCPLRSRLISPCHLYPKYERSSLKDLNVIGWVAEFNSRRFVGVTMKQLAGDNGDSLFPHCFHHDLHRRHDPVRATHTPSILWCSKSWKLSRRRSFRLNTSSTSSLGL
jgi:hypothetical protein